MAQPKFTAGQSVSVARIGLLMTPLGAYRIVQALPREGGPQQYRVRHDGESFDRVVDEVRLQRN